MKRKIVSVLLALVLTLALLPTGVLADDNVTELTMDSFTKYYGDYILDGGSYILKQDLTVDGPICLGFGGKGGTFTLDLNSFTLKTTSDCSCTLYVDQNSTLTLEDSKGGGAIVSTNHSAVKVCYGAAFTMESGNIRGGGSGVDVNGYGYPAIFTMKGGSVTGGINAVGRKSTVYLNAGTVDEIWLDDGNTLYANGGTVTGPSVLEGTVVGNSTDFQVAGQGTSKEPWELKTADQLKAFRDLVNKGYITACAKLVNDIVLDSSEAWTPIGNYTIENQIFYKGTFDGNGHTISGLNVNGDFQYAGLFGAVKDGTIKNLTVAGNVSPSNTQHIVGSIVGYASNAAIENCSNHCSVTGHTTDIVGGIAGFNVDGAKIIDCYNVGTICSAEFVEVGGGIVGHNAGTISNCYNVGTVSIPNSTSVGEIVGNNYGTVENCYYLTGGSGEGTAKTVEEFSDGTVRELLKKGQRTGEDPWDSKCRLVVDVNMTLPVFKWQAPEEPASSGSSGSRFSYSTISASAGENGSVSPSGNLSVRDDLSQTFVFTPDKGYRVKDVLIDGQSVGALRSYTFATVRKNRTVEVIFEKIPAFVDVPAGSYYEDAVNWAVENWITEGTDDTHFSPDAPCTRAQAVTFLWRAAGCPSPASYTMPFADVKSGSYYETAVLWALENNIVSGTSETTFEPDAVCTRAQIVCFLFRYKAANGMDAVTLAELLGGYTDSAEIPAYASPALNWALSANVLQGSDTKLLPNEACTRAQIVTLLYRTIR